MTAELVDEWDHYQAAADAYQGAYRLGVDRAECLELAVDVARKPLLIEPSRKLDVVSRLRWRLTSAGRISRVD